MKKEKPEFLVRLEEEQKALSIKIANLSTYLGRPGDKPQGELLIIQLRTMEAYNEMLELRLRLIKKEGKNEQ